MSGTITNGTITAYDVWRGWGFIDGTNGTNYFFHIKNSPGFAPALGLKVQFEVTGPFKLGQKDQAVNLRRVESVGGGAS